MALEGTPDRPTVTAAGERLLDRIVGVELKPLVTHLDERGEICELFDPRWGVLPEPVVYAYQATIRPGKAKGWVRHRHQDDRLALLYGTLRVVLYDGRPESPSAGRLIELFAGVRRRLLVTIPRGVWHAVQNVGHEDVIFVNFPTRAYQHDAPDKERLPLDTDQIPFRFDGVSGW